MHLILIFLGIFSSLLMVSCAGEEQKENPKSNYYEHTKPIIDAKCMLCHRVAGSAPFSLENYKEVYKRRNAIKASILDGTMPPWGAQRGHREFKFDYSLTQKEKETLLKFISDGSLEGSKDKEGKKLDFKVSKIEKVDLTLKMAESYTPQKQPDEYRCFPMDWTSKTTKYITGFNIKAGNFQIDHHAVAYLIEPKYAKKIDEYEKMDAGYGYDCFGAAVRTGEPMDFLINVVGVWAPGMEGMNFPKGTGIKVEPGSKVVIQMHYSTLNGTGPDLTQFEFSLADKVEKEGYYRPWFDLMWYADKESMKIAAGEKEVSKVYEDDPNSSPGFLSVNPKQYKNGFSVHSIFPHMHILGKSIKGSIIRKDKSEQFFVNVPKYDFNWQYEYIFKEALRVEPGDKLKVECIYDNSPENQPIVNGKRRSPTDVFWGEGTVDEMCIINLFVTD